MLRRIGFLALLVSHCCHGIQAIHRASGLARGIGSIRPRRWIGRIQYLGNLGFTDGPLRCGIVVAAVGLQTSEARQAMQWAHSAGWGAYIFAIADADSRKRQLEFEQVASAGHHRYFFDVVRARGGSGKYEQRKSGGELPRKPEDPRWECSADQGLSTDGCSS